MKFYWKRFETPKPWIHLVYEDDQGAQQLIDHALLAKRRLEITSRDIETAVKETLAGVWIENFNPYTLLSELEDGIFDTSVPQRWAIFHCSAEDDTGSDAINVTYLIARAEAEAIRKYFIGYSCTDMDYLSAYLLDGLVEELQGRQKMSDAEFEKGYLERVESDKKWETKVGVEEDEDEDEDEE